MIVEVMICNMRPDVQDVTFIMLLCLYCKHLFCRGREDCRSMGRGFKPWPMFVTPVITHRSYHGDWLAQFSLKIVHKSDTKQYSFHLLNLNGNKLGIMFKMGL
jgi:hypothetical protein